MTFNAETIGLSFSLACTKGTIGIVHSIFDKAFNIAYSDNKNNVSLLTILRADGDVMPAALLCSNLIESWHDIILPESQIIFTPNTIYLDTLPLITGIQTAYIWIPASAHDLTTLPKLSSRTLRTRCDWVKDYIHKRGRKLYTFPKNPLSDFNINDYLGHGPGLTPSGDDFLAGLLFSLHFAHFIYGWNSKYLTAIRKEVLHNMKYKTNQISQHFLHYAANGLWGQTTEQFMISFFQGDFMQLENALEKKLTHGATSGTDEIQGILVGFYGIADELGGNYYVYHSPGSS